MVSRKDSFTGMNQSARGRMCQGMLAFAQKNSSHSPGQRRGYFLAAFKLLRALSPIETWPSARVPAAALRVVQDFEVLSAREPYRSGIAALHEVVQNVEPAGEWKDLFGFYLTGRRTTDLRFTACQPSLTGLACNVVFPLGISIVPTTVVVNLP